MGRRAARGLWLLTCLVLWGDALRAAAQNPIPADKKSPSEAVFSDDVLGLWHRDIDQYRRHTKDPEAVLPQAEEFLRAVQLGALPCPRGPGLAGTMDLGKKAFARGYRDPLVRAYYAAIAGTKSRGGHAEMRNLSLALDALRQSDYPSSCQRLMLYTLYAYGASGQRLPQWPERRREAIELAAARVGDETIGPEKQRIVLYELSIFLPAEILPDQWQDAEALHEACQKQPKADPWTLHIIAGHYYRMLAWHHHVDQWGGDMRDLADIEAAEPFLENMRKAADHYAAAFKLHPEFPEAAANLIEPAGAGVGDRTSRQWFDEAVAAQMDYLPAYDKLKMALQPGWVGGGPDEMYRFGCECADTERYDTDVPFVLLRVVDSVNNSEGRSGNEMSARSEVYAKIKRVLEGMAGDPSRADGRRLRLARSSVMSIHAAVAQRAGEYADARRLLDELGDRLDREAYGDWCVHPELSIAKTYAFSGAGGEDAKKAAKIIDQSKELLSNAALQEARTLYRQALEADRHERSRAFCQSRIDEIDDYLAFSAGKWVEKKFDAGLLRWTMGEGVWSAESEHSAIGVARPDGGRVCLRPALVPPLPLEVEFGIESVSVPPWEMILGLFVPSSPGAPFLTEADYQFCILPPQDQACVRRPDANLGEDAMTTAVRLERVNRLRVQLSEGRVVLYVNDQLCIDHSEEDCQPSNVLNLGCFTYLWPDMPIRLSNVRIRRWDHSKETPAGTNATREKEAPKESPMPKESAAGGPSASGTKSPP